MGAARGDGLGLRVDLTAAGGVPRAEYIPVEQKGLLVRCTRVAMGCNGCLVDAGAQGWSKGSCGPRPPRRPCWLFTDLRETLAT